jgi:inner membrane protein
VDTPTQALLGATIAQAGFAHRLGRRAVGWGAAAAVIPDLDVLAGATHGPFGVLLYHRGPTHALWFGWVLGPLLGYAVWRLYARGRPARCPAKPPDAPPDLPDPGDRALLPAWMGLFAVVIFTHPLLDLFTTYGTQLLAPFSLRRFALNGIAIIDPFYSVLLAAALAAGWMARARRGLGTAAAALALALSTAYLFYGLHLNRRAETEVRVMLAAEGVGGASVRAYPTIFQPYLRRIVARTPDEVRVGLYSTWRPEPPVWERFRPPPPHPLVEELSRTREGSLFIWFAMGEITHRVSSDGGNTVVEIDDLRYGFPGAPDRGIWGIRAAFDHRGRLRGPVQRFDRGRPGLSLAILRGLAKATFGDFSELPAFGS